MSDLMATERAKCPCGNLARHKGRTANGEIRHDNKCHACHRGVNTTNKYSIVNSQCWLCGWDRAPCDRHRIIPKAGYKRGNVISLCPNCHRLLTMGFVSLLIGTS